MPYFRTILVAADFSEQSQEAFQAACAIAHESKTRLVLLHVVERPAVLGELGSPILLPEDPTARDSSLMKKLRDEYAPNRPLDVEYRVHEDIPAEDILRISKEIGADLIVLGTHGRTGLLRLLTGSVAESVLRRANCPVMALHVPKDRPTRSGPIRTILHPTDFSECSKTSLQVARTLARDQGARLFLLYVEPIDVIAGVLSAQSLDPQSYYGPLKKLQAEMEGPDLKYPVEIRCEQGDPATEILRVAEEIRSNLMVLGSHGRTALGRFLMGSVAESVLRQAGCPALIVKPTQLEPTMSSAEPSAKSVIVI